MWICRIKRILLKRLAVSVSSIVFAYIEVQYPLFPSTHTSNYISTMTKKNRSSTDISFSDSRFYDTLLLNDQQSATINIK